MAHHDNNGNGHGHGHDAAETEGNRQYYPKGWWVPLAGLVVIAFGFCLLAGFVLGVSGTDKWGKHVETEQTEIPESTNPNTNEQNKKELKNMEHTGPVSPMTTDSTTSKKGPGAGYDSTAH